MTCTIDGCVQPARCRRMCGKHYTRWKRHGDANTTLVVPEQSSDQERLNHYGWCITEAGCWEWGGPKTTLDYGRVGKSGTRVLAHRLAYETWVGPIPDGHVVRHKCDNPPCINPDHLETGTQADNVQDMHARGRRPDTKIREDKYQEIAKLYYVEGLRQVDIARIMSVSQITISRHLIKMRG